MNRRDFVKALAGIPLLGLLVKPIWERSLVKEFVSRAKPMWGGKIIFVDEVAGNDANDGLTPATAVISGERVCALASAPRGDIVIWM